MKNVPLVQGAVLTSLLLLAGCNGSTFDHGGARPHFVKGSSAIIGGTTDSGHPAVALLYNSSQGYLCTGTMISKRVFLTAGHCTSDDTNPAHYQIAGGSDPFNGADWVNDAAEIHTNPNYSTTTIGVGDTGIVVLSADAPVTPMAYQQGRNDSVYEVGTPFEAVGYGITDGTSNQDTSGVKRHVQMSITDLGSDAFAYGGSTKNTCSGDSGGPAIEMIGGTETIIGTVSYGDSQCQQQGVDMRTDDEADFISQYADSWAGGGSATPTPTPGGNNGGTPTPTPGDPANGGGNGGGGNSFGCDVTGTAASASPLALLGLAGLAFVIRRKK